MDVRDVQTDDAGTYICLSTMNGRDDEDVGSGEGAAFGNADYFPALTIILRVRSIPGPVSRLGVRLSTILGALVWEFPTNHSGGYPLISFTAQFRKYEESENVSSWEILDPQNIPANVVSERIMYRQCI